ncbi:M15 family metallopeptidase [Succinatimonas hippei]|uniref:M15 family metallopeptidase n=1 Tax=Succinatimonas hippei TaxID=626938 RepID=UPI002493CA02|nr:M15 family metallopeptidase [Succinatimonas hippei]
MALTKISEQRLSEVDGRLQKVIRLALSRHPANVQIAEGKRDLTTQKENLRKGVSQTLKSKHLDPDGEGPKKPTAVDVAIIKPNGKYSGVMSDYKAFADTVKSCAKELSIPIKWGGDWKTLKDGPHFELIL